MKRISTPEDINNMFSGFKRLDSIHYLRVDYLDKNNNLNYAIFEIGYNIEDDGLTYKSLSSEETGDIIGSVDYDHTLSLVDNLEDLKDLLRESIKEGL